MPVITRSQSKLICLNCIDFITAMKKLFEEFNNTFGSQNKIVIFTRMLKLINKNIITVYNENPKKHLRFVYIVDSKIREIKKQDDNDEFKHVDKQILDECKWEMNQAEKITTKIINSINIVPFIEK